MQECYETIDLGLTHNDYAFCFIDRYDRRKIVMKCKVEL